MSCPTLPYYAAGTICYKNPTCSTNVRRNLKVIPRTFSTILFLSLDLSTAAAAAAKEANKGGGFTRRSIEIESGSSRVERWHGGDSVTPPPLLRPIFEEGP